MSLRTSRLTKVIQFASSLTISRQFTFRWLALLDQANQLCGGSLPLYLPVPSLRVHQLAFLLLLPRPPLARLAQNPLHPLATRNPSLPQPSRLN